MKKHILVISQYFYPEQFRINDISSEWIKRGYEVTVVTGVPNYPQGRFFDGYGLFKKRKENYNGIDIIRLPIIARGKNSIMLALNYFSFVVSGYFWKLFTKIKADYVFIFEVSPMTQALPGVWYAKKRKIPCYLYVQDLWPENVEIVTGISNKTIIGSIGRMVDYIYRNCDKIFTTSRSFIASISARGIERDKLEFWPQYAEEFYKPLNYVEVPEIDSRKFNVTFTGNVGQAQGLDILIEVAKEFINENVMFNLIGDGRYKEELIIKVKNAGVIDLFNFIPRQEPTHIPKYLAASQVVFLSLSKNKLFEMTIPAKLQSYFACGKPVLASISGESASIIKEANAGYVSEPGGVEELVNNLKTMLKLTNEELSELGRNARKYYLEHFEKNMLLNDMDKHFELKENKYV